MIRRFSFWSAVTLLILGTVIIGPRTTSTTMAEDIPEKQAAKTSLIISTFMKIKLRQAEGILEGLTIEDFSKIEKNATAMSLLTRAETWNVNKDPKFIQHSNEFARLTTKLAKYGREKNLDGAALTYVQLTLNCVECHRFLRDDKIKTNEPLNK